MSKYQREWTMIKEGLVSDVVRLGHPEELGEMIARQLGSPKAMQRFRAYLHNARPQSAEEIVDEMLAIQSEIDAWREKKAGEKANARYNEILYYGLENH